MLDIVKVFRKFLIAVCILAPVLVPALQTRCEGQAYPLNLRYPLVFGVGRAVETSTAFSTSLQGPSYLLAWDCNDHITAELKAEMLSNKPTQADPYSKSENQVSGALQEHVTMGRITPYISEIYGTGWTENKDPSANFSQVLTVTMGGAVGGEVRLYRGTSARVSLEVSRWPPQYTYPGGYSKIVTISITQNIKFFGRDIVR